MSGGDFEKREKTGFIDWPLRVRAAKIVILLNCGPSGSHFLEPSYSVELLDEAGDFDTYERRGVVTHLNSSGTHNAVEKADGYIETTASEEAQ